MHGFKRFKAATTLALLSLHGAACAAGASNVTSGAGGGGGATSGTGGGPTTSTTAGTGGTGGDNAGGSGGMGTGGDAPLGRTFAVDKLFLGDTDRNGAPNKVNGWKQYGYDIDGLVSTASSVNLCKPRGSASAQNVYPDGVGGIDNSFGRNILPIILGISSNTSLLVNQNLATGQFTIMLDMPELGPGEDQSPLLTRLYSGTALGQVPQFDGTDVWPVGPESLLNPSDVLSAKVQFLQSAVVSNVWTSGSSADLNLALNLSGTVIKLNVLGGRVSMDLSSDHSIAKNGTIGGVIATEDLLVQFRNLAGGFDPSLCSGPTIDSILAQVNEASDILKDGTQDPTKECDGISVGLGFDASNVVRGGIGPAAPPDMNPCGP